jgi:hypothetical protein
MVERSLYRVGIVLFGRLNDCLNGLGWGRVFRSSAAQPKSAYGEWPVML